MEFAGTRTFVRSVLYSRFISFSAARFKFRRYCCCCYKRGKCVAAGRCRSLLLFSLGAVLFQESNPRVIACANVWVSCAESNSAACMGEGG